MHREKLIIAVRGLANGEPGPAAVGVRVTDATGKILHTATENIGNATSEYAEYYAVVYGLRAAADLLGCETRTLNCQLLLSNQKVAKQLNVEEEIHNVSLVGHFIEIHNVRVTNFPTLTFAYVKPAGIEAVEKMVTEALDGK